MTHIESLLTKIMIINYTALCKLQLVLKQTTTVQPAPPPCPELPKRRKPLWSCHWKIFADSNNKTETCWRPLSLVRRKESQIGEASVAAIGLADPRSALTPAQCPGVAWRLGGLYWHFGKIIFFLWALLLSRPVVPGVYARLRLPSRFRKLLGLTFISANWMEYSWPFQWNQLTPCEKEKNSRLVSIRQGVHRPLPFSSRSKRSSVWIRLFGSSQLSLASPSIEVRGENFQRGWLYLTFFFFNFWSETTWFCNFFFF